MSEARLFEEDPLASLVNAFKRAPYYGERTDSHSSLRRFFIGARILGVTLSSEMVESIKSRSFDAARMGDADTFYGWMRRTGKGYEAILSDRNTGAGVSLFGLSTLVDDEDNRGRTVFHHAFNTSVTSGKFSLEGGLQNPTVKAQLDFSEIVRHDGRAALNTVKAVNRQDGDILYRYDRKALTVVRSGEPITDEEISILKGDLRHYAANIFASLLQGSVPDLSQMKETLNFSGRHKVQIAAPAAEIG